MTIAEITRGVKLIKNTLSKACYTLASRRAVGDAKRSLGSRKPLSTNSGTHALLHHQQHTDHLCDIRFLRSLAVLCTLWSGHVRCYAAGATAYRPYRCSEQVSGETLTVRALVSPQGGLGAFKPATRDLKPGALTSVGCARIFPSDLRGCSCACTGSASLRLRASGRCRRR